MSKKQKVMMHPSSAVSLLENIFGFMVSKKIDRDDSHEVVGKITIKPPKQKQSSPSGKITLIIKKSSSPEDNLRA